METNTSNYSLITIFSIVNEENEVHPVSFYFYTFTVTELNYEMYDKKLLAIFKAFKFWQHYLESPTFSINIVVDYKNLEYFSETKMLT